MTGTVLSIENLACTAKTLWGKQTLLDISRLEIGDGEILGLVGESGSGKSILAQALLRILPGNVSKTAGKIIFRGVDMDTVSERDMRRAYRGKQMAMIFQDPMASLNPVFTVFQQIGAVIREHYRGLSSSQVKERAIEMLKLVKLSDPDITLGKYPHELSGGMRQRILIATALCSGAKFLISDEATRSLDVTIQAGILKLLESLRTDLGLSTLFISSNMALAASVSERIGILYGGNLVEIGRTEKVLSDPRHFYTKLFLSCLPTQESKNKPMKVVKGLVAVKFGNGCKFAVACPDAGPECKKMVPALIDVGDGHFVSCLRRS